MTTNNEDLVAKLHNAANACHDEPGWMGACELFSLAADRLAALTTGQEIDPPSVREAIGEVLADMEAVIDGVPVASDLVALQEITDAAIQAATSPPSRTAKRTGYETVASAVGEHSQKITARAALSAPQEGDMRSPWTRHGHLLPGRKPDEKRPPVARCGGPKLCHQCSTEAGNVHAHESAQATNVEQPVREALAECLFIANKRRDGGGPTDEQWRQYHGGKAFGYRRLADAVLAAFPALSRSEEGEADDEPCDAETHSWDHYRPEQIDSYWIRCTELGKHDEHRDSNTGLRWAALPVGGNDE